MRAVSPGGAKDKMKMENVQPCNAGREYSKTHVNPQCLVEPTRLEIAMRIQILIAKSRTEF